MQCISLQEDDADSDDIASFKESVLNHLNNKFTPHILHKVAVFLNPRQKSMRVLSRSDREEVTEHVTDLIDTLPLRAHQQRPASSPPAKRRRCDIDEFDDLPVQEEQLSELEAYKKHVIKDSDDITILQWWMLHQTEYPALSVIARRVFCVMATSAPSERNFSLAGIVVSERRSALNPSSVNDILVVNSAKRAARQ